MASPPRRLIALGASNLTRGLATVVDQARRAWGEPLEVLAALGHGRSYGLPSSIPFRVLPGILQSGLWAQLERLPPAPARALLTDVGNDVLYGVSVAEVLGWVEEALDRLRPHSTDVVTTDLPLDRARRLSRAEFAAFTAVVVPSCRVSLAEALDRAGEVNDGVAALAARRGLPLVRLLPAWYGFDPIHVRRRFRAEAWRSILFAGRSEDASAAAAAVAVPRVRAWRLYLAPPERRRLFGVEQTHAQPSLRLRTGTAVWQY